MAALKPFAPCVCLLLTATHAAFGGAMRLELAVTPPTSTSSTNQAAPTSGPANLAPEAATPPAAPATVEPGVSKMFSTRQMQFRYRPLGLSSADDRQNSQADIKPVVTSTPSTSSAPVGLPAAPPVTPPSAPTNPSPIPVPKNAEPSAPLTLRATGMAPEVGSNTAPASPAPVSAPAPSAVPTGSAPITSTPSLGTTNSAPAAPTPMSASTPAVLAVSPSSPLAGSASAPSSAALATSPSGGSIDSAFGKTSGAASTSSTTGVADAYLNFGAGPYADASRLTTGDAKPWYSSPVVSRLYGGATPSLKDQAAFETKVASTVSNTYQQAGVPVRLTTDPTVAAAHTLSVVANTQSSDSPGAIGIATVGFNGFTFVDKFTQPQTVDDLATAIGHNVAHELMHTFGVEDHPEATGNYVDAATATWSTLSDPNASFSQPAANLLSTLNFHATDDLLLASTNSHAMVDNGQGVAPSPVPEPSTIAIWALAGTVAFVARRRFGASRSVQLLGS